MTDIDVRLREDVHLLGELLGDTVREQYGEAFLQKIEDIRRSAKDGIDALKGELGDDERARGEKELEVITKKYVDAIDEALKHKEAELLKV